MNVTEKQAFEFTQRAIAILQGFRQIRSDARLALLLSQDDDPMPGIEDTTLGVKNAAAMCVRNLAFIVVVSKALRDQSTPEVLYSIRDSIDRRSIDRPACLPAPQACCHEFAVPLAIKTLMRFQSLLLERCGFHLSVGCVVDPSPLDEFEKMIHSWDNESAECILEIIVEAIDATNFSDADFDVLVGAVKREGTAIASSAVRQTGINEEYSDEPNYGRDKFIWENIVGSSVTELSLELKRREFSQLSTPNSFKKAALRWAKHRRYESARTFKKERPMTEAERRWQP